MLKRRVNIKSSKRRILIPMIRYCMSKKMMIPTSLSAITIPKSNYIPKRMINTILSMMSRIF